MKSLNKNQKKLLPIVMSLFMVACSNKEKDSAEEPERADNQSEMVAVLTPDQIETVGIVYGKVEMKQLTATLKANGTLRVPNNSKASVTSLYSGVIRSISVQLGDHVKQGQVIASIANPEFIQLQEDYLSISSKIIFAEQEAARQKELFEGNAGALKNLQNAKSELGALKTRKSSLYKQLQLMGVNPARLNDGNFRSALTVTSPISGTVSNLPAKIGTYVDVASPVAEIVDNSQLHLDLNVFERDLPSLKIGQTIHFTLTNNAVDEFDARIYSIGSSFENDSKSIPVHATVQGKKDGLIDGMNVTAIVSLNDATARAVPDAAIVNSEGKDYVFVLVPSHGQAVKSDAVAREADSKNQTAQAFEKTEVVKGVSNMGYTAITFVKDFASEPIIVVKGSFFINAKLTNKGEE